MENTLTKHTNYIPVMSNDNENSFVCAWGAKTNSDWMDNGMVRY